MAKAIMVQGTMSNSGKSFITAALCRIFRQDGYSVAPFKSQNMALNSYITEDGYEIGRAQAMQAEAAGIEPSVFMNPILLKPTTDIGSQVIVNGKVYENMTARDYFKRKTELIPHIKSAFEKLSEENDIIVIEGAGSPVELNLKSDDIVNMGMAKIAKAPVILVGDIDLGGVFAQLLGTVNLFEPDERSMVKAMLVNKFRGDISLFNDGREILEQRSGIPVLGVVPHTICDIEDEDSLSHKLENTEINGIIDIAVIRLPKMSNFTDFDVFSQYDGVSVRYVSRYTELGMPDLIIIPGTKSTISDMKFMRESGIETAVKRCIAKGVPLFGICGGYQILGNEISDPCNTEGGGSIAGMGILNCKTVLSDKKKTVRTEGQFNSITGFFSCISDTEFEGYEIHAGVTEDNGAELTSCGGSYNGNVAGCYIHGIFDNSRVSEKLVKKLYEVKGVEYRGGFADRKAYKEKQFDILAENVRNSIDMELLYKILNEGI